MTLSFWDISSLSALVDERHHCIHTDRKRWMAARPLSAYTQGEGDTSWTRKTAVWRVLRALATSLSCAVVTLLSAQSVYLHYMDHCHWIRPISTDESNQAPFHAVCIYKHGSFWRALWTQVWYCDMMPPKSVCEVLSLLDIPQSTISGVIGRWRCLGKAESQPWTVRSCQITEQVTDA